MTPFQGEKTIYAYFDSSEAAYKTADSLQGADLGNAVINRIPGYDTNDGPYLESPVFRALTASAITGNVGDAMINAKRAIQNATPSTIEGGNSNGNTMLIISTSADKADQAADIIRKNGGSI